MGAVACIICMAFCVAIDLWGVVLVYGVLSVIGTIYSVTDIVKLLIIKMEERYMVNTRITGNRGVDMG